MKTEDLKAIHTLIVDDKWVEAANLGLVKMGKPASVENRSQGLGVLRKLFQYLLDQERYLEAATLQWGGDIFNTEPESVRRVFTALTNGSTILLMGASSMSKCIKFDEPVICADGTVKRAEEIKVGDKLMGDDGQPRNVLLANYGYGPLYRITPSRGKSWVCNDEHILSLRVSSNKKCGSGAISQKWKKGEVVDIPIKEYLELSKDKKNRLKQFHVGVEMNEQDVPWCPYIIGSWLGDGTLTAPTLNTPHGPMSDYWMEYFSKVPGFLPTIGGSTSESCKRFNAVTPNGKPNPFRSYLSEISECGEKRIPDVYLRNSRKVRLALLAGLIDSDGWVHQKTSYQIVTKYPELASQIAWLARSLGFSGHTYVRKHTIKSINFSADYHHILISGAGVTEIPTLEKHCSEPSKARELNNTSFTVTPEGEGKFYGFVLDGNHRYLLGDFTVTHNTYSAGAWMLLDYLRDPFYTTVKLAAINEDHLKKNLFAHVATLFRGLAIPPAAEIIVRDSDLWMGVKEAGYEFGISGLAFKQSQETSGQFKGYKAKPVRVKPSAKFGVMSRLRVLGDEGQNWPGGPFKDFNSLTASKTGSELIKVVVAFNPESTDQHVVKLAEPEHGWCLDDVETLYDYKSKADWLVCRLDAAKSENVIQRKNIYIGLQTYEGYMGYLKSGGDSSANFFTFARGFPPLKSSVNTIISPTWPQAARGEATFIETPTTCAAVDLAFMGKDSAQMVIGRWGLASGWKPEAGEFKRFEDRTQAGRAKPKHVLQIDQIFPLQKHEDTIKMAEEIVGRCKMINIQPQWLGIDKTGYGFGTWSHLAKVWGDVYGIQWNEKATEKKILSEDLANADKQAEGVMSEMWWAFRRWLSPEAGIIFINPIIPTQPIHTQLTSRRYKNNKNGLIKVEPKEDYMARNKSSPDEADAMVMLVHTVRKNTDVIPGLVEYHTPKKQDGSFMGSQSGPIRFMKYDKMSDLATENESIAEDARDEALT